MNPKPGDRPLSSCNNEQTHMHMHLVQDIPHKILQFVLLSLLSSNNYLLISPFLVGCQSALNQKLSSILKRTNNRCIYFKQYINSIELSH